MDESKFFGNELILACLKADPTWDELKAIPEPKGAPAEWMAQIKWSIEKRDITSPEYIEAKARLDLLYAWANKITQIKKTYNGPLEEIKTFALDDSRLQAVAGKVKGISKEGIEPLATALRGEISSLLPELGSAEPSFTDEILTWDSVFFKRLESLSEVGQSLAGKAQEKAVARRKQWNADHMVEGLWKIWSPTAFLFAGMLAAALWPAVKAELEKEPKGNAFMCRDLSRSISHARFSGGKQMGTEIRVIPAKGFTLYLPFDSGTATKGDSGTVSLRQHLDASALHTLVAAMQIFVDSGRNGAGGRFQMDEGQILDAKGASQRERNRGGKIYPEYRTSDIERVRKQLHDFSEIRVSKFGDYKQKGADALLSEIERISTKEVWYRFSELIQINLFDNYLQLPRVAVRDLESDDIPLALGIGEVVRGKITSYLTKGKLIEATVENYLETAGVDYRIGLRKDGLKYWPKTIGKIVETSERGDFGTMRQAGIAGKDAILTLNPSEVIKEGYSSLVISAHKHAKTTKQAEVFVAKDKLTKSR